MRWVAVAVLSLAARGLTAQQAVDSLPAPESVSDYDVPPKILQQKKPKYPNDAFRKGIQGTVVVEFIVETTGDVQRRASSSPCPGSTMPPIGSAARRGHRGGRARDRPRRRVETATIVRSIPRPR